VTIGRAALTLAVLLAAATRARVAAAQFSAAQPAEYLLSTDVYDGRAVWLQPAALSRRQEASVAAHLTLDRAARDVALADYGLTVASGGFALGWQHDRQRGGPDGTAWALGLGLGDGRGGAGFARRWYRFNGSTHGTFDIGVRFQPRALVDLSLLWRDIGDAVVRDTVHKAVIVPGIALNLLGGRVRVGGESDLVADGLGTSEWRAGATLALGVFTLRARGVFSSGLDGREVAASVEWNGRRARLNGFGARSRTDDRERIGVSGAVIAQPPTRRFGGR